MTLKRVLCAVMAAVILFALTKISDLEVDLELL